MSNSIIDDDNDDDAAAADDDDNDDVEIVVKVQVAFVSSFKYSLSSLSSLQSASILFLFLSTPLFLYFLLLVVVFMMS